MVLIRVPCLTESRTPKVVPLFSAIRFRASRLSGEKGGGIRQEIGRPSLEMGRGAGMKIDWPLPIQGAELQKWPPFFC